MSDSVQYSLNDGVATLTLANGKVNAVSPAVIEAFNTALDQAQAAEAIVIVTGQPGILSGGYDLKVMMSGPQAAIDLVAAGSMLARRMLAHPQPIIVACPGHAVAKGAFMLLSADYRIGVEGAFSIGLNEVKIGMTMHHVGIALARDRLSTPVFQRSVINAEMFNPQSAMTAGFLDQVVPADQLMATANAVAQEFKKLNMKAHANTKLKVRKALLDTLDAAIESDKLTSLH
ncbi:crotonase/enoyl-CoA hydratase family protein [Rhodoferax sp. PAMC 29310]|uniref:crotonase/enoyl-CoA hydratase family protein n=1 Tax=Rhodoferax sp. PAMC 29310 TaxID=2822760 RepID=UPI001B332376|nr:crotonase/enoyl-CoA hydratase family protein [Rhodoferax sp. PAMC 29310]